MGWGWGGREVSWGGGLIDRRDMNFESSCRVNGLRGIFFPRSNVLRLGADVCSGIYYMPWDILYAPDLMYAGMYCMPRVI